LRNTHIPKPSKENPDGFPLVYYSTTLQWYFIMVWHLRITYPDVDVLLHCHVNPSPTPYQSPSSHWAPWISPPPSPATSPKPMAWPPGLELSPLCRPWSPRWVYCRSTPGRRQWDSLINYSHFILFTSCGRYCCDLCLKWTSSLCMFWGLN
jgi:hypothetical protein